MFNLTDQELQEYIKDDLPYFDLTTHLQNRSHLNAKLEIFTREDIIVACSEEASRVAELLGCKVEKFIPSSQVALKDDVLLSFSGSYDQVHQAWRLAQILLEYSCKIATTTHNMVETIHSINPNCELLTTRKTYPFAKRFNIKAVIAGGGMPHRLGLSETILLFAQHRIAYNLHEDFLKSINALKHKAPEKKIVVESESYEDAVDLMEYGANVLQMDKVSLEVLKSLVEYRDDNYPNVKILAAGGINVSNVSDYVKSGVDTVVTSSVYLSGMSDLSARMSVI